MHSYCQLAKKSIKHYLATGKVLKVPRIMEKAYQKKAGVFVSLHKNSELRGCIGTYLPTKENLALEIINNAIAAAFDDVRFEPLKKEETGNLEINVDVLSEMEKVKKLDELDPKKYGIFIKSFGSSTLLLPDIEGVGSIDEQLLIARQKAGISKNEPIEIYKFTVKRFK